MLEVINLSVNYGKNIALDNVNFIINKGTITSVIGKNGSGKSTLIHSIAGFVKYSGNILYNNSEIMSIPYTMRAKEISLLPQKLTDVGYTVYELVSMGRNPYVGIGKRFQEIDYIRINNAITAMGIDGLKNKPVNQLSGGERQKAYIAMILAQDTELVIYTTRPGIWIGPSGREVNRLKEILKDNFKHHVEVSFKEIKFYSGGFLHYEGDENSRNNH